MIGVVVAAVMVYFGVSPVWAAMAGDAVRQYSSAAFNHQLDYTDLLESGGFRTSPKHPPGFDNTQYDYESTLIAAAAAEAGGQASTDVDPEAFGGGAAGTAAAAATTAAFTNVAAQELSIALGQTDDFSWKSFAASAVGGAAGSLAGSALGVHPSNGIPDAGQVFVRTVSGVIGGVTTAVLRGGRWSIAEVAADAFGNSFGKSKANAESAAIGNAGAGGSMGGYTPYSSVLTEGLTPDPIQVDLSGVLPGPVNVADENGSLRFAEVGENQGALQALRAAGVPDSQLRAMYGQLLLTGQIPSNGIVQPGEMLTVDLSDNSAASYGGQAIADQSKARAQLATSSIGTPAPEGTAQPGSFMAMIGSDATITQAYDAEQAQYGHFVQPINVNDPMFAPKQLSSLGMMVVGAQQGATDPTEGWHGVAGWLQNQITAIGASYSISLDAEAGVATSDEMYKLASGDIQPYTPTSKASQGGYMAAGGTVSLGTELALTLGGLRGGLGDAEVVGNVDGVGSAANNIYASVRPLDDDFPQLQGVNPHYVDGAGPGININCTACANAVQQRLLGIDPDAVATASGYGNRYSLLPSAPFGFGAPTTVEDAAAEMLTRGEGATNPLIIQQAGGPDHVITATVSNGQVVFVDGQMGAVVTLQPKTTVVLGNAL